MNLHRVDVKDSTLEKWVFSVLKDSGFKPSMIDDVITLEGVGVGSGDSSVDLSLNLVELEGLRVIEITSTLRTKSMTFERAILVSARGNLACLTAKFTPVELPDRSGHIVQASMVLYADYLNEKELRAMIYLFVKEVDVIDNELISLTNS